MNQHDEYKIIEDNPNYQKSLNQLRPSEKSELNQKIERLKHDPSFAVQLRAHFKGKYKVVFGSKRYRLVISINWFSHSIKLHYVKARRGYITKP